MYRTVIGIVTTFFLSVSALMPIYSEDAPEKALKIRPVTIFGSIPSTVSVPEEFVENLDQAMMQALSSMKRFTFQNLTKKRLKSDNKIDFIDDMMDLKQLIKDKKNSNELKVLDTPITATEVENCLASYAIFITGIEGYRLAAYHNKVVESGGSKKTYRGVELGLHMIIHFVNIQTDESEDIQSIVFSIPGEAKVEAEGYFTTGEQEQLERQAQEQIVTIFKKQLVQEIEKHPYFNPYTRVKWMVGNQIAVELNEGETLKKGDEMRIYSRSQVEGTQMTKDSVAYIRIYDVKDDVAIGKLLEGTTAKMDPVKETSIHGVYFDFFGGLTFWKRTQKVVNFLTREDKDSLLAVSAGLGLGFEAGYGGTFELGFNPIIPLDGSGQLALLWDMGFKYNIFVKRSSFHFGMYGSFGTSRAGYEYLTKSGTLSTVGGGGKIDFSARFKVASHFGIVVQTGLRFVKWGDYTVTYDGNDLTGEALKTHIMDKTNNAYDSIKADPMISPFIHLMLSFRI